MSAPDRLLAEIREQPARWRALAADHAPVAALGTALAQAPPPLVRIAAHGTSDHAATYAKYALRLLCGWTAMQDSMSVVLYYGATAARPGDLAIGISQSGETPDVVAWLRAARAAGARTAAITNGAGSALALLADDPLAIGAGEERSVAATKTYTGSLAVLALLGAYAGGRGEAMARALEAAADARGGGAAGPRAAAEEVAAAHPEVDRLYVVGRGMELATAHEVALKLTEIAYVAARALSATSLAHGPIAALDPAFGMWAIADDDRTLAAVIEAATRARATGAPMVAVGPAADRIDADVHIATPALAEPLLNPLLSVLPGQLYARALALAKGLDPAAPRHLRKVTAAA